MRSASVQGAEDVFTVLYSEVGTNLQKCSLNLGGGGEVLNEIFLM